MPSRNVSLVRDRRPQTNGTTSRCCALGETLVCQALPSRIRETCAAVGWRRVDAHETALLQCVVETVLCLHPLAAARAADEASAVALRVLVIHRGPASAPWQQKGQKPKSETGVSHTDSASSTVSSPADGVLPPISRLHRAPLVHPAVHQCELVSRMRSAVVAQLLLQPAVGCATGDTREHAAVLDPFVRRA